MTIDRRSLITVAAPAVALGGAFALTAAPVSAAAPAPGSIVLITPFRLTDSRINEPDKYDTSATDGLAVAGIGAYHGVVLNLTVTETEGAGFVWVGKDPLDPPPTSNLNWSTNGQTVANLAIVNTGLNAGGITLMLRGSGRAHVIIDVLAFIA